MNDKPETENTNTALVAVGNIPPPAVEPPRNPAQARVEAVSNVLYKAYEKASILVLTPEECERLKEDFPDDAFKLGAGGNPELIYIEHAYLRDRFDSVFGMGQWALVRSKPHWGEEFVTQKGQKACRVYADCALLIRGCLVSEAIGEMVYYPNNATQSYGDAAEGSETAAFRRCAKKLGVGLQAWKKDFCAGWVAKSRSKPPTRSWERQPPQDTTPAPKVVPRPPAVSGKASNKLAEIVEDWAERCRDKLLKLLQPNLEAAWTYAVRSGWIMDNERLEAVKADSMFPGIDYDPGINVADPAAMAGNVANVRKFHQKILEAVQAIADGEPDGEMQAKFASVYVADDGAIPPDPPKPTKPIEVPRDADAGQPDEWWREVAVHFGQAKGELLGEMEKNRLWGWWKNWEPKEFKGQISKADENFRAALDAAGEHYGFRA